MTLVRSTLAAAICLAATASAAQAQAPYPAYIPGPAPAAPQSWSYDPYTSGLSACVQWRPGDTQSCRNQRLPTYGQPSYAPIQ
jgi:hypothetical protein